MAPSEYEVIVVVDLRSTDDTAAIARAARVQVVQITPMVGEARYTAGARNAGIARARGPWVAFTDADCVPSRGWLRALLAAADDGVTDLLAVAGQTVGLVSNTPAARYVDLTGGLRSERHLAHERYPWPVALNVMYRRTALAQVGGYDVRFESYEQADLHLRLVRKVGGRTIIADKALVSHRHRSDWRSYWRQQVSYGIGYGQFFLKYRDELPWNVMREAGVWLALGPLALRAAVPGTGDGATLRRGDLVKRSAQRLGFARTYWSRREAARWRRKATDPGSRLP